MQSPPSALTRTTGISSLARIVSPHLLSPSQWESFRPLLHLRPENLKSPPTNLLKLGLDKWWVGRSSSPLPTNLARHSPQPSRPMHSPPSYMPSPQVAYRQQGPYDMAPIANSLPTVGYRTGQFPQGGQRYAPMTPPQMLQQVPHIPPYGGPPQIPMNQGFYIPQYWGGGPVSPCQAPPPMSARQTLGYYPNRMVVNHPQSALYYAQGNPYPGQPPNLPMSTVHGHYPAGSHPNPDVRKPRSSVDGSGMPLKLIRQGQGMLSRGGQKTIVAEFAAADESGNRQGAVRGPPRKPRQSGETEYSHIRAPGAGGLMSA